MGPVGLIVLVMIGIIVWLPYCGLKRVIIHLNADISKLLGVCVGCIVGGVCMCVYGVCVGDCVYILCVYMYSCQCVVIWLVV